MSEQSILTIRSIGSMYSTHLLLKPKIITQRWTLTIIILSSFAELLYSVGYSVGNWLLVLHGTLELR